MENVGSPRWQCQRRSTQGYDVSNIVQQGMLPNTVLVWMHTCQVRDYNISQYKHCMDVALSADSLSVNSTQIHVSFFKKPSIYIYIHIYRNHLTLLIVDECYSHIYVFKGSSFIKKCYYNMLICCSFSMNVSLPLWRWAATTVYLKSKCMLYMRWHDILFSKSEDCFQGLWHRFAMFRDICHAWQA